MERFKIFSLKRSPLFSVAGEIAIIANPLWKWGSTEPNHHTKPKPRDEPFQTRWQNSRPPPRIPRPPPEFWKCSGARPTPKAFRIKFSNFEQAAFCCRLCPEAEKSRSRSARLCRAGRKAASVPGCCCCCCRQVPPKLRADLPQPRPARLPPPPPAPVAPCPCRQSSAAPGQPPPAVRGGQSPANNDAAAAPPRCSCLRISGAGLPSRHRAYWAKDERLKPPPKYVLVY